jgi:hypothetical protein
LQGETANAETPADEVPVLTGLFRTLGGILLIAMLSSVLMLVAVALQWVEIVAPSVGLLIGAIIVLGLVALFLALVLPVRLDQTHDALQQGAGVTLLVYPLMMSRYTLCRFLLVPIPLGPDTPHWIVYSIAGILLLVEPRMKRVSLLRGLSHSVLEGLVLCLGLLTAALTLFLILEGVMSVTLYTITVLTASLVVVVFTVMSANHTRAV